MIAISRSVTPKIAVRLSSTGWANSSALFNVSWSFTRNPASQIRSETQSSDAYSWQGHVNVSRNYTTNGLNQYTQVGTQGHCHDANGNLTADGAVVYLYDVENRLVEVRAAAGGACGALSYAGNLKTKLRYDPLGRLFEVEGFTAAGVNNSVRRLLYDGDALVAEYDASGIMLSRYIHGPNAGSDDPLAEYIGSGVIAPDRRNLYADARGSIVLRTKSGGGTPQINAYDEFGIPGIGNVGRFQYTGQAWIPELGMYYYKARIYSATLGRFLQTDPIGYEDDNNLYAYVGNDPVNMVDPDGMESASMTRDSIAQLTSAAAERPVTKADRKALSVMVGLIPAVRLVQIAAKAGKTIELLRVTLSLAGVKAPGKVSAPPRPPIVQPAPSRTPPRSNGTPKVKPVKKTKRKPNRD